MTHSRFERLVMAVGRHFAAVTDKGRSWPAAVDVNLGLPDGNYTDLLGNAERPGLIRHVPVSVLRQD